MKWKKICLLGILVTMAPAGFASGSCPADIDGDGNVTLQDLLAVAFADSGDPRADLNGNGFVGEADWITVADNLGSCPSCPADLNGDGFVDAGDRSILEKAFGTECNGDLSRSSSIGDNDLEIARLSIGAGDPAADPDADPRADVDRDGTVDFNDLVTMLFQFGSDCSTDLNSDGEVDTDDLWFLLGSWGPCS